MSGDGGAPRVRLSLRTRWTLALLAVVLVSIGAYAWFGVKIQRRGLAEAERGLEVAVSDHVADLFVRTLSDAADATHRVGVVLTAGSFDDVDARMEMARDAVARADGLTQVAIYTPDGAFIEAIVRRGEAARGAGEALAPTARGDGWLAPVVGADGVELRYVEAVRVDGEAVMFVVGTLGAGLSRRLADISRDRFDGRDDGVLVLGGDRRVLFGPSAGPLAVGSDLQGRDVLAGLDLPADAFAADFGATTEFTADGEAMVGSLRAISELGFAVVVRRPASAVYRSLRAAQEMLVFVGAALAALAMLTGAWLAGRTTRSVKRLTGLTRAYARREFSARWQVGSGDEMDVLGAAMTAMADDLAAGERELQRRAAVEAGLSRFLPAEVARRVAAGEHALTLGGERRTVSVLFADVVSFTTFAEKAAPESVVKFLNELFTVLAEVVFRHGGTVDKFIGDCVMAIFGAPDQQDDHAARALACAEDMHRFVETSAPAWRESHGIEARLGIGVNAGEALVGNLGSEQRMEYTAIGDVVNVAARLEGMARAGQTLITAEVARAAGEGFVFVHRGEHALRGKHLPVEILEVQ
ncbi:MAG: HAMP domain-containing protein [Myxococcales bacterium]|nr:HAMP domain-containing protein [Myxococcales bacterium]